MKPEIKVKWLEALRSGKYAQGRGRLVSEDTNLFCCLGVLCDIQQVPYQKVLDVRHGNVRNYKYKGASSGSVLPFLLAKELELPNCGVSFELHKDDEFFKTPLGLDIFKRAHESATNPDYFILELSTINDQGFTFEQIAHVIERFF